MGRRLVPEILNPVSSDLFEYASLFRVIPWVASGTLVGKTLNESGLRRRYEINVLGYWRDIPASGSRKPRPAVPGPDYRIGSGDTLLLIGLHDAVEKFLAEQE
jgi:Trk K+ transport system NAD-binding subunit